MTTTITTADDIWKRIREVEERHRRDINIINDYCHEVVEEYSMETAWNEFVKMVNPHLRWHLQPLMHDYVVTKELTVTIRATVQAVSEEHAEELVEDFDYTVDVSGDFEYVDSDCDYTTFERD